MEPVPLVNFSGSNSHGMQIAENSGSNTTNFNYYGSEPKKLKPFAVIPFSKDPEFVNRGDILEQIHQKFRIPAARVALVGLGGVGKSQIAIEFSHQVRQQDKNKWIFWVHASSSANFEKDYKTIAQRLELMKPDDPRDALGVVWNWLSDESNGEWVLIVDNADHIETFKERELSGSVQALTSFLPQVSHGKILFTSRDRNAALSLTGNRNKNIIEVTPMNEEEGQQLVKSKLDNTHEDPSRLLEALDYIPLAITQATAYINQLGSRGSISKYLEIFHVDENSKGELLMRDSGDIRRPDDAKHSILITWQISFDYLREYHSTAAGLLSLMSFFNQQGIPEFVLKNYTVSHLNEGTNPELRFEDDIAVLQGFSLISTEIGEKTFQLHRLIKFCTQKWLERQNLFDQWNDDFLSQIERDFPYGGFETWEVCKILYPHVESLAQIKPVTEKSLLNWARIVRNASEYSWRMGRYQTTQVFAEEALAVMEAFLVEDHLEVLSIKHMLALSFRYQGKYEAAEALNRYIWQLREKALGPDHPSTLTTMSNLALVLNSQGKYQAAEAMNRQVWQLKEKALGPDHPSTLTTMSNLALVLNSQGKYQAAEAMNRQVWQLKEKAFGPDHPETLTTMSNLADVLNSQGKYQAAEAMNRQVWQLMKKALGPDHPSTLATMSNLADVLNSQGKYQAAEAMNRQVWQLKEKALGPDHPDTLATMSNLALVLNSQGKYQAAEAMNRQVWQLKKKALGPDHPSTLITMSNLALVLNSQGKYQAAETMNRQVWQLKEKAFGPDHPDTLITIHNLATSLIMQNNKYEEAETLCKKVMQLREKVLGAEHPDTLTSTAWMAYMLQKRQQYAQAVDLYERAISGMRTVLGPEHPDTVSWERDYTNFKEEWGERPEWNVD